MLPQELVRDFVGVSQTPVPLEPRFQFGVRYRFVSEGTTEDPETGAVVPVLRNPAQPVQATSVLDRLAFSRVGRTWGNDQPSSTWKMFALRGPEQAFSCGMTDKDWSGSGSIQK